MSSVIAQVKADSKRTDPSVRITEVSRITEEGIVGILVSSGPRELSVIERCSRSGGVRKERFHCTLIIHVGNKNFSMNWDEVGKFFHTIHGGTGRIRCWRYGRWKWGKGSSIHKVAGSWRKGGGDTPTCILRSGFDSLEQQTPVPNFWTECY